jgi:hypothetical protein
MTSVGTGGKPMHNVDVLLAERRIFLTPSEAHEIVERAKLSSGLWFAVLPATRERAIQHQMRNAFGMANGIFHRNRASLRDAEKVEAIDLGRVHYRFEVSATCAAKLRSAASQSERPQPRASKRMSRLPVARNSNQSR